MTKPTDWQRYKKAWTRGETLVMDGATFDDLFHDHDVAQEAVRILGHDGGAAAKASLQPLVAAASRQFLVGLCDADRLSVCLEVVGADREPGYDLLMRRRIKPLRARERAAFVSALAQAAIGNLGRQRARALLARWWREGRLIEEEQESLLLALDRAGALGALALRELGADASACARRLAALGRLSSALEPGAGAAVLPRVEASYPGNSLAPRVSALLQPVSVDLDIRDAGLRPDELAALAPDRMVLTAAYQAALSEGLRQALPASAWQPGPRMAAGRRHPQPDGLQFPLIRLLHLCRLLDAPSLASALASPEHGLVADVVGFVLGHDAVAYQPELRVARETERRWRARWSELTGEAMSVLFLESALDLDLTTLMRIPERNDGRTPDFQAASRRQEPIIFESKGATSWKTHVRQRSDALAQLGKGTAAAGSTGFVQPNGGRAFAMSVFAARQGDDRSSLLHVEDPPFPFDKFFHEGWQDAARRQHYAAVMEVAQLDSAAAHWRAGRPFNPEDVGLQSFTVEPLAERTAWPGYVGTYLPTLELARSMRHPDLDAVRALRIFVGLRDDVFQSLLRNQLPFEPTRTPGAVGAGPDEGLDPPESRCGLLPGKEPGQPARGAYSLLANGSLLAVELT